MKVALAMVFAALLGLLVFAQTRRTILHAKPNNGEYNGFANADLLFKWDQCRGLQSFASVRTGETKKGLIQNIDRYKHEFDDKAKTGEVVNIDPKTNLTLIGYYAASSHRIGPTFTEAARAPSDLHDPRYFAKVRLPNGREYFMEEQAIGGPRPNIPGKVNP